MGGKASREARHASPQDEQLRANYVSVIIPALNEESNISKAIESVRRDPGFLRKGEIIVVDGGSHDGTARQARRLGAKVLRSARGRGVQMNTGAAHASGDLLLFLHADSQLPARCFTAPAFLMQVLAWVGSAMIRYRYTDLMQRAVEQYEEKKGRRAYWGCFQTIQLDAAGLLPQVLQRSVALRTRLFRLPYGDQALFVRASVFRQLGGFLSAPLMEDVDLVRRLSSRVGPPAIVPHAIATSSRRWQKLGFLQTTLQNWCILTAFSLGADPHKLALWYYGRTAQARTA